MRQIVVWLALAGALMGPIAFLLVRAATPSDDARVAFYESAWSRDGVQILSDDPDATLRSGDVVATIAGRSLEAWLADTTNGQVSRPDAADPIAYGIRREGASSTLSVGWARPALGAGLLGGAGFVVMSLAFAAVAAFVFAKRPDEPAALPLVLLACATAASTVPWYLGITTSDIVHGGPFLLHSLLTGPVYMVLWPAALHLALVFPEPHPVLVRRRWLARSTYVVGIAGYVVALLVGRSTAPTLLEWVGTWPSIQLAFAVPMLVAALLILVRRYVDALNAAARVRMRWAAFGVVASGVATLAGYWLPQLLLGRSLFDYSWLAVFSLPVPLSVAMAILRHRLFDIDVAINRTLVYGSLTLAIVTTYAAAVTALGSLASAHGSGASLVATAIAALVALPLRDVLQRAVNRVMYGHRDEPWRAMRRLGQGLAWAADPDGAFPRIVDILADSLRLPYVALALAEDGDRETVIARSGEEHGPTLTLPLVHGPARVGRLVLGVRSGERGFRADELRLLEDLARQAGTAIAAIRLRADLARSRERLVFAREEERRRLRRDLHDGLGPALAAIGMRAEAASERIASDPDGATRLLHELNDDVRDTLSEIRHLVDGLRPAALDEIGLVAAIEEQVGRLRTGTAERGSAVDIVVDAKPLPLPELPAAVEVAAYRIAVEAVTNAVRHSGAAGCRVRIEAGDDLTVEVVDDGRGLPVHVVPGVGLESIRVRAEELGGSLRVEGLEGRGTHVLARLPIGTSA